MAVPASLPARPTPWLWGSVIPVPHLTPHRTSGQPRAGAGRGGKAPPTTASRKLPPLPYKGRRATSSAPRPWNVVTTPRRTNASPGKGGEYTHRVEGLSSWLWLSPSKKAEALEKNHETRGPSSRHDSWRPAAEAMSQAATSPPCADGLAHSFLPARRGGGRSALRKCCSSRSPPVPSPAAR